MSDIPFFKTLCGLWILLVLIEVCQGLQCYYCSGQTYSDPNDCFHPTQENTFVQECVTKGEVCETKRVWVDGWTEKIERGCSSNCAGRKYIWTEDFKVYCCNDSHFCNGATSSGSTPYSTLFIAVGSLCLYLWNR